MVGRVGFSCNKARESHTHKASGIFSLEDSVKGDFLTDQVYFLSGHCMQQCGLTSNFETFSGEQMAAFTCMLLLQEFQSFLGLSAI